MADPKCKLLTVRRRSSQLTYYCSDLPGVASAGLDAKILNETEVKTNAKITTDFSKDSFLVLQSACTFWAMLEISIHLKRRKVDKAILGIMCYFVLHILASCATWSGNLRVEISYHPLAPIAKQDCTYPVHNVHFHHAHSEEPVR